MKYWFKGLLENRVLAVVGSLSKRLLSPSSRTASYQAPEVDDVARAAALGLDIREDLVFGAFK